MYEDETYDDYDPPPYLASPAPPIYNTERLPEPVTESSYNYEEEEEEIYTAPSVDYGDYGDYGDDYNFYADYGHYGNYDD